MSNINWQAGYLIVVGKGNKERIVPIGRTAFDCLNRYVEGSRRKLSRGRSVNTLFLNRSGNRSDTSGALEDCKEIC